MLAEAVVGSIDALGQAGNDLPAVVRGVVDLAFREADGWVIVDYKTDVVSPDSLPAAAERYRGQLTTYREAWREISGEAVKEAGLFFTRIGQFQSVAEPAML